MKRNEERKTILIYECQEKDFDLQKKYSTRKIP